MTPTARKPAHERRSWTGSPDLQAIVGRDGRFRAVNPAWTHALGYATDEVVGHSILEFVLREDVVSSRRGLDEVLSGIDLRSFENCVVHKNGELRWISWNAWAEHDLVFIYGTDVTAEKTEAMHRLSVSGLRSILQTDAQYQALLTPEGVLFGANSLAHFGPATKLADIVGKPFWTAPWFLATPGMSDFVENAVRLAAVGNLVRQEVEIAIHPGSRRRFDFTLRPLRDDGGSIEALLHTAVDCAEHRGVGPLLHHADKAGAMGKLVSGIAHNFANALEGIEAPLGMIQGLLSEGRVGEVATLLAKVRASTRHASRVAHRLLHLAAERPFDPIVLDVAGVVTAFMEIMRDLLGPEITIDVVCDEVWPVVADRNRFESALLNLCVNARDAMPSGGRLETRAVNVSISADFAAEAGLAVGDYVCVSVTDRGAGMTPETSTWACEPFFTTKRTGRGTGFGLFMASSFALEAEGRVHIASAVGTGTTVSLYLPRLID